MEGFVLMVNGAFMVKRALPSSKRARKNPDMIDVGFDIESQPQGMATPGLMLRVRHPWNTFPGSLNCFYGSIFLVAEKALGLLRTNAGLVQFFRLPPQAHRAA